MSILPPSRCESEVGNSRKIGENIHILGTSVVDDMWVSSWFSTGLAYPGPVGSPGMTASDAADTEALAAKIRSSIGDIMDLLPQLGPEKAATRLEMQAVLADLRQMLKSIEIPGEHNIKAQWANAAGAKPEEVTTTQIEPPVDYGAAAEQKRKQP